MVMNMKKNIFLVSLVAFMTATGAWADLASTTYVTGAISGKEDTSNKLQTMDAYNADQNSGTAYVSAAVLTGALGAETSAREEAISGLVDEISAMQNEESGYVATANAYTDEEIKKLDVEETTGDGVVKQIAQENGKIVPTKEKIGNADIADGAAIDQAKINGLVAALAERITTPSVEDDVNNNGVYVLTYSTENGFAWEQIERD